MTEALALQALEWVAFSVTQKFIQKAVTYLSTDLAKELKDLETTIFPQFVVVIKAAENSPHKQTVANWLRRLKNAYYDTEDIFDELEYQRLENEVTNAKKDNKSPSSSVFNPLTKLYNTLNKKISLLSPTQTKLRNQLQDLKRIAEESRTLCELLKIQPENTVNEITSIKGPKLSASIPVNKVIGRNQDRDRIIGLLVDEWLGETNRAIAITGIGGAGKTTLAQFIFNNPRVVKYFDVRIWVCLSPKLNVIKHTKEMIESASIKNPQLDTIDALQRKLNDILLNSKHTLLVLDDICYNGQAEEEEWSQLLAPFTSHVGMHKILLTSRSNSLPIALNPINHESLRELNAKEFKSLFRYFAFSGAYSGQIKELEEIGDKIAEKLLGSPLAAKAVASRLSRNLDYREWRNTLVNVNLSNISDSLLWTYQRLDLQLQRCFLYCSIFPKGYLFTEFELVNLWVCENFTKCSGDTSNDWEKAKEYFNELLSCSFFQTVGTDQIGGVTYKIHDLFHDLAEKLSKEDCFRIEGSIPREIPSTIRYISVSVSDLNQFISIIVELDQVRTVLFLKPFVNDVNEIFAVLLSKLKKLRVLKLFFFNSTELPEVVGELKHLRYLETFYSSISELPDSLCKLYHLQVLLFSASVKKLPTNLSNLKLLRHLLMFDRMGKPVNTLPSIPNLGKLTSLETVRQFQVKKENCFELHQLGNLKRIKGFMRIENLENGNRAHAIEAKLCDKKDLIRLELMWGNYNKLKSDFDLEVIEGLQPHDNLKHLLLVNYGSDKYPSWLLENSVIRNLHSLALEDCKCLRVVPSNLTHCNKLVLRWIYELRDLSHLPESLTSLTIEGSPSLIFAPKDNPQFSNQDLTLNETEYIAYWLPFINRDEVHISTFRNEGTMLERIPMPKNKDYYEFLQIYKRRTYREHPLDEHVSKAWWYCHQQRMNFVYRESFNASEFILPSSLTTLALGACNITDGALSDCLGRLTSLNELRLESIMTLTTLPSELVMRQLKLLKILAIITCWCLRSLGYLQGLVSLEKLVVGNCPCLDLKHKRDSTTFPVSLESLSLWQCVIPDDIFTCHMSNLNILKFDRCRGSKFISIDMLTSLRILLLWNCPDLCKVKGLQSLSSLKDLILIDLPKFQSGSLLETPMGSSWRRLDISSMEMLKVFSASNAFVSLKVLFIKGCQEETFTLVGLACIPSLEHLSFAECKIKTLPSSLKYLSSLKVIQFIECPEISSVPELPESITEIKIDKCPVLKERCQPPDGPDWPKIVHIPYKRFTD